jgi:hypothetical protein
MTGEAVSEGFFSILISGYGCFFDYLTILAGYDSCFLGDSAASESFFSSCLIVYDYCFLRAIYCYFNTFYFYVNSSSFCFNCCFWF